MIHSVLFPNCPNQALPSSHMENMLCKIVFWVLNDNNAKGDKSGYGNRKKRPFGSRSMSKFGEVTLGLLAGRIRHVDPW